MPRQNIDYTKTIIYKIVCNDENIDYLYIGSTTNFTKRKNSHKSCYNNENNKNYNQKKYVEMRNNGDWDNFKMIEIEKYPCNDKREAEAREEEIRKELKANMNSNRCFTTEDQRILLRKEYYNENKEKIREKMDSKCDCPCGGRYTYQHKTTHLKTKKHLKFLKNANN